MQYLWEGVPEFLSQLWSAVVSLGMAVGRTGHSFQEDYEFGTSCSIWVRICSDWAQCRAFCVTRAL